MRDIRARIIGKMAEVCVNTEKRKEKSRDAARCRRSKESEVFVELASCLPLSDSVSSQLDKASIMRLSLSMLKIYNMLGAVNSCTINNEIDIKPFMEKKIKENTYDHLHQKALEGFAYILAEEGDIVYLTENVSKFLGLPQMELMGQSIYDFTHPCDHDEIKEMLTTRQNPQQSPISNTKNFFIRVKCTLTSKGRNVNLKSATYKVFRCSGRLLTKNSNGFSDSNVDPSGNPSPFHYLVGIAEPIPHPSNIEVPLDSSTFLSKHSMDMRFVFCDNRIKELAGYTCEEMIGQSFYGFHHGLDSDVIDKAFKDLFAKGQVVTGFYRFLVRTGGYMWVVTQATVINNSRTQKPQSVVCVHYILSGVEDPRSILSHVQSPVPEIDLSALIPLKVELSTENIFAPRVKDMDKGYFLPPEMNSSIMFRNDETQDLSYLAPSAGGESIPLAFDSCLGHN
ncbi:unnamed protein product, partial [Candidula unifasciata]